MKGKSRWLCAVADFLLRGINSRSNRAYSERTYMFLFVRSEGADLRLKKTLMGMGKYHWSSFMLGQMTVLKQIKDKYSRLGETLKEVESQSWCSVGFFHSIEEEGDGVSSQWTSTDGSSISAKRKLLWYITTGRHICEEDSSWQTDSSWLPGMPAFWDQS